MQQENQEGSKFFFIALYMSYFSLCVLISRWMKSWLKYVADETFPAPYSTVKQLWYAHMADS